MLPKRIAFVDTETTGLSPLRDRIIEIGIVVVENNAVVKTYESLINPHMYVSPMIEELTGIRKSEVDTAPCFEDIKSDLFDILEDCVFVAHNVRFDYAFLKNEFARFDVHFAPKHFCTAKLSRMLFPSESRHNLDSIIERFNFVCKRRHRAFDDAFVLWQFYEKLQEKISLEKLDSAVKTALGKPSLPQSLSGVDVDSLPQAPGVYIFYGENGVPLYIGKSKNIRNRVLSHFSSDHRSPRELTMSSQIKSIEAMPTAGELGALIKEATLIKDMQPLFNRKLRVSRKLIMLLESENKDGYKTVIMETVTQIDPEQIPHVIGIFKSKKQAKNFLLSATKAHMLCEKLVGLEKIRSVASGEAGACFAYRLDLCKGACVQKEKQIRYNLRFMDAFTQYKLKSWPFTGPIAIKEKNDFLEKEEQFIVDKWCLLPNKQSATYIFDLDTYKILLSFLEKPSFRNNIFPVSQAENYLES
jgi:DNA polymerase-3 subunit epsilon